MKTFSLPLLLLLLMSAEYAYGQFGPERIVVSKETSPDGARSVYAADLDGDGDLDLASASEYDDKIAWYENLGDGSFSAQKVVSTAANGATSVYAADLDGDGDLDLASASRFDYKIAWYENLGGGSFSAQKVVSTAARYATSVIAADLDADGDLDLASASSNDDKIAWYENLGGGSFSAQKVVSTAADGAWSVFAADLDGDGDMDLASASEEDDKIAWYENLGGGSFSAQKVVSTAADGTRSVYAADLDGDGDLDLSSASHNDNKIAWYENLGGGSFSAQKVVSTSLEGARSVCAADLDGDGDLDLASASTSTASYPSDRIAWNENLGGGRFSADTIISKKAWGANFVYAADLNGDGDLDLISASFKDNMIAWYENLGDRSFSTQKIVINSLALSARSVYAADLDGDGDMDLASASFWDGKIAWYENMGHGRFSAQNVVSTGAYRAMSVIAVDLDGDGDMDLVSAHGRIEWYENQGGGSFSAQKLVDWSAEAESVFAADLDGDGDMDLASASGNNIAWYENLGGGSFSAQKEVSTAVNGARSVFAADLDGDGDMDLASASFWDDKIAWYENLGGGSFSAQKVVSTATSGAEFVYAADLDGDGDLDLASASWRDNKIAWYENLGGGSFSAQKVVSTAANGAMSVYSADLDGDGDMDLASASSSEGKIAWYENLGGGSFSAQKVVSTAASGAQFVYAADLDGDGDMDLASASKYDDKIAWYENLFNNGGAPNSTNTIEGQIHIEETLNCQKDSAENLFEGMYVRVKNRRTGETRYGASQKDGRFQIKTDTGSFRVQPMINSNNYSHLRLKVVCPAGQSHIVRFDNIGQRDSSANFALKVDSCPFLTVSIGSSRRRRCFKNTTTIEYKNEGFKPSANAHVLLEFPAFVRLVSADRPFTKISDSLYRFEIGRVAGQAKGQIIIIDSVICGIDTIRGVSQCTKVSIFPANNCDQTNANEDGPNIDLRGVCAGETGNDFLVFVKNTGADMLDSVAFRVYQGTGLAYSGKLKLAAGDSLSLYSPNTGRAFRVEVDQAPGHPYQRQASVTMEDCGVEYVTQAPTAGLAAAAPINDEPPEWDIECLRIIDSYDPNDKTANPSGILAENFTRPGTRLSYRIRFQNTGSDTAYTVLVVDTLDTSLDLSTLQLAAHSHDYEFKLKGRGRPVLEFTHRNINLPDSATDELGSQGFLTYTIEHYDSIPDFTEIRNAADIYFDFNLPIRTNTTLNTMYDTIVVADLDGSFHFSGDSLIFVWKTAITSKTAEYVAYPNPTTGLLYLKLPEGYSRSIVLVDPKGATIRKELANSQLHTLDLRGLSKGIYFLQIPEGDGFKVVKIMKE